jgi:signal transduction histidine kinase
LIIKINESIFNLKQRQEFQNIEFNEQQRLSEIEDAKTKERVKYRMWGLITGLTIFLFIAIILYRNSLQRKKANTLLSQQKNELEKTLTSLRTTQNQLVQSEKMASLGEMTAGIAHEIQNPLNFVNNFSELNTELIDELKAELEAGNKEQAIAIANDLKQNEEKIIQHGKRADGIVKSMLQHSRSSSGKKELTDINALTDEYVRLAYHGLRAKDKSFNAKFQTDFDNSIDKVHVIPQEIGRVLLNLINNAFYAVSEKEKQTGENYEPTVTVTTKREDDKITVTVKDNGNGIPQKALDKIFQPFFTTKPAGQGTGLGLSLSYDIITNGHGGEFKVETKEGEGSVFVISLPVNNVK